MDATREGAMGFGRPSSLSVSFESVLLPRMVHRDVRIGNLPFKFVYCVPDAEN